MHAWPSGIQSDIPYYVGSFDINSTIFQNVEICATKRFLQINKEQIVKEISTNPQEYSLRPKLNFQKLINYVCERHVLKLSRYCKYVNDL
jgi:hypothetical protein